MTVAPVPLEVTEGAGVGVEDGEAEDVEDVEDAWEPWGLAPVIADCFGHVARLRVVTYFSSQAVQVSHYRPPLFHADISVHRHYPRDDAPALSYLDHLAPLYSFYSLTQVILELSQPYTLQVHASLAGLWYSLSSLF
jgi:hypothetical protein